MSSWIAASSTETQLRDGCAENNWLEEKLGSSDVFPVDDIPSKDAWPKLVSDPECVLIDVRTKAEWAFVGLPDLSQLDKELLLVEWQTFPDNRIEPEFTAKLTSQLEAAGVSKSTELFFICRSGGRSRMAAEAMAALGYERCRNVSDGFEGRLNPSRQRGNLDGWKVAGLPWVQG